jgi:hypothetical protein
MKRTAVRVEPISTHLERRRKGPIYPVIVEQRQQRQRDDWHADPDYPLQAQT